MSDLSGNAEKENNTCEAVPDEVYFLMMPKNEVIQAKKNELQSWKDNQVYTEVPDAGQDRVKIRWIYTTKEFPEGSVVKAQLVARGFKDPDAQYIRSGSPTYAKESIYVMLAIITLFGWVWMY